MASDWSKHKLGDVCEINPLKRDNNWKHPIIEYIDISSVGVGQFVEDPKPIPTNEAPSRAQRLVQDGDTIVSTVRPNRRSMLFIKSPKPNTVVSTGFAVLHPRNIDPRFLYYTVFNQEFTEYLTYRADGSAYPAVLPEVLSDAEIYLPPFAEQRAIAGILGALDDKIELNRRMNRTLESMARAVFRQWFVENEEVRDWEIGKFSEISDISRDSVNPGLFPYEMFNHFSIPAYDESRFPAQELGEQIKSNKFIVSDGCILISKLNPEIQRIWLPLTLECRSICSTEFLVNAPKGYFTPEFLYGLFYSQSFQDRFTSMTTGTSGSHQRVKAEYVLDMDVELPPEGLVMDYTEMVRPILKRVQQNILELRTLASLRDALLPKLMRGEVRVK